MDKPFKMLIIDDDSSVLSILNNYFMKKNFDVKMASNGLDAIKIFEAEKTKFDVVITDIVMPDISGVGVISMIKKKYPDTRIIAITGWGEQPEALAAEAEADLVMEKPVDLQGLEDSITSLFV